MSSVNVSPGGFSLFPNPNMPRPPSRKTTPRSRAGTSHSSQGRGPSLDASSPRNEQRIAEESTEHVVDGMSSRTNGHRPTTSNPSHQSQPEISVEDLESRPPSVPPKDVPPKNSTAVSSTSTLVRDANHTVPGSTAQQHNEGPTLNSPEGEPAIRSIFPQYDYSLPFDQQNYYPTQASPTHIPKTVISRQSHVPQQIAQRSPPVRDPGRSPMSIGSTQPWPRRQHEPSAIPPVSTTEDLQDYWKAAEGTKASHAEARTFCMKLVPEKDTPIYSLLSSSQQPLYHMRFDPTSASAYVTLSRHDPSKPCKEKDPNEAPRNGSGLLSALRDTDSKKAWQEVIATSMEEPSRRLRPNDGLIAMLHPSAVKKLAAEHSRDATAISAALRECARLVWDEDSLNYFLVHPAVPTPFCVTIERSPAWSRTEYAVEHLDSPQHLGRLTRDGTGEGWLELDTLVASRIDAKYILDVAAAALLLVAHLDEKNVVVEQFAPPPAAHLRDESPRDSLDGIRRSSSLPSSKILSSGKEKDEKKNKKKRKKRAHHIFGSQGSSFDAPLEFQDAEQEKLPGIARTFIKLAGFAFKVLIWFLTLAFNAAMAILVGLTKCMTSEKL